MKKELKIFTLSLVLALSLPTINAQLFDEGDIVFSGGLGLGSTLYSFGALYNTSVPPLWVSGDYCLREDLGPGNLGVGAILGYTQFKWGDEWGYKYSTFFIAARGTYHFTDLVDKLDLYGGIDLGAKIASNNTYGDIDPIFNNYSTLGSGVLFEPFAGARYYFADNIAGMAELGYGIAVLKLGISFKL
jgi:hypothetical protein